MLNVAWVMLNSCTFSTRASRSMILKVVVVLVVVVLVVVVTNYKLSQILLVYMAHYSLYSQVYLVRTVLTS